MNKKYREVVFNKFGGKCAYCGDPLVKGWHVDHVDPVIRKTKTVYAHWKHEDSGEILEQNQMGMLSRLNRDERNKWKYIERKEVPDGFYYPELNKVENMYPACASCNINKHNGSIEDFREMIADFMNHLNGISTQYKLAKRYGLITETGKRVTFYFESERKQGE